MSLKQQIINILRNQDTQRISFNFAGTTGLNISVSGDGFRQVANAIEKDQIQVVTGGAAAGKARYSAHKEPTGEKANTFYIGEGDRSSRIFDALIVHESVHAIFDLSKFSMPWIDNETAAYIAQGNYLRNSGFPQSRLTTTDFPYLGLMIIESIIKGDGVPEFWMKAMHNSLESDPDYHDYIRGTFTGDG